VILHLIPFLAEDAAKRLNQVLNIILAALIHREKSGRPEYLRSDAQSGFIKLHALSNGMVNHLTDVPAPGGQRQMIHPSHLLSKGADVKIINCLPQLSLRGRTGSLFVWSSFVHASSNLKCSRTFGNQAMAAGFMI
jgi:hypothetical protein